MSKKRNHLGGKVVKRMISKNRKELLPFYTIVDAFNSLFSKLSYERVLGFRRRTRIVLMPDLSFNLTAKQKPRKRIGLNIGVLPLVHALVANVSKLNFVCEDIPFDKSFDQKKTVNDIADIFNAVHYQIDNYELDDDHISELLDTSDLGTRGELSYSLFKKTLFFLFFHEFAHIQCRHASRMGKKSIMEFQLNSLQPESKDKIYNIQQQWAELEADHLGADLMIEMLKIFDYPLPEQKLRHIAEKEANELRQIIFVIGLIFLLFSYCPDEETSVFSYSNNTHPHPCVRMVNMFDVLANYVSAAYFIDIESICDVMSEALLMLIVLSRALGIHEFEVIETNLDEIKAEITRLQRNIGRPWIETSNQLIVDTIIHVRNEIALV